LDYQSDTKLMEYRSNR